MADRVCYFDFTSADKMGTLDQKVEHDKEKHHGDDAHKNQIPIFNLNFGLTRNGFQGQAITEVGSKIHQAAHFTMPEGLYSHNLGISLAGKSNITKAIFSFYETPDKGASAAKGLSQDLLVYTVEFTNCYVVDMQIGFSGSMEGTGATHFSYVLAYNGVATKAVTRGNIGFTSNYAKGQ